MSVNLPPRQRSASYDGVNQASRKQTEKGARVFGAKVLSGLTNAFSKVTNMMGEKGLLSEEQLDKAKEITDKGTAISERMSLTSDEEAFVDKKADLNDKKSELKHSEDSLTKAQAGLQALQNNVKHQNELISEWEKKLDKPEVKEYDAAIKEYEAAKEAFDKAKQELDPTGRKYANASATLRNNEETLKKAEAKIADFTNNCKYLMEDIRGSGRKPISHLKNLSLELYKKVEEEVKNRASTLKDDYEAQLGEYITEYARKGNDVESIEGRKAARQYAAMELGKKGIHAPTKDDLDERKQLKKACKEKLSNPDALVKELPAEKIQEIMNRGSEHFKSLKTEREKQKNALKGLEEALKYATRAFNNDVDVKLIHDIANKNSISIEDAKKEVHDLGGYNYDTLKAKMDNAQKALDECKHNIDKLGRSIIVHQYDFKTTTKDKGKLSEDFAYTWKNFEQAKADLAEAQANVQQSKEELEKLDGGDASLREAMEAAEKKMNEAKIGAEEILGKGKTPEYRQKHLASLRTELKTTEGKIAEAEENVKKAEVNVGKAQAEFGEAQSAVDSAAKVVAKRLGNKSTVLESNNQIQQ